MKTNTVTLADLGVGPKVPLTVKAAWHWHGFVVQVTCLIRLLGKYCRQNKLDILMAIKVAVLALLIVSFGWGSVRLVGYVFSDWHPDVWWFADWWWAGPIYLFS